MVSEEEVRDAFRRVAAGVHPDSGGDEGEFAGIQVAQEVLLSPSRRLREWLSVRGVEVEPRGEIGTGLMDLFARVAEVGSAAEAAMRGAEGAQSALGRGMAEVRLMGAREAVKDLLGEIEGELGVRVCGFGEIEEGGDVEGAAGVMRELIFLEKWKGTLRGMYGRLM